jgi:hypothetical protein
MTDLERLRALLDDWQVDYEIETDVRARPLTDPMTMLSVDSFSRGRVQGPGTLEFYFDSVTSKFDHIGIWDIPS